MQKLSPADWGAVPKTSGDDIEHAGAVLAVMDAVPAVSGLVASGSHLFEQGLSDFLYAKESTEGCGGLDGGVGKI